MRRESTVNESLVNNMTPTVKRLLDTLYENHGFDLVAEAEELDSKRVADLILEGANAIDQDKPRIKAKYIAQAEQISVSLEDIVWNDFVSNLTADQKAGFEQIIKFHPTAQLTLTEKGKAKSLKNIIEKWNDLQKENNTTQF
jgi:hypothetical protein